MIEQRNQSDPVQDVESGFGMVGPHRGTTAMAKNGRNVPDGP